MAFYTVNHFSSPCVILLLAVQLKCHASRTEKLVISYGWLNHLCNVRAWMKLYVTVLCMKIMEEEWPLTFFRCPNIQLPMITYYLDTHFQDTANRHILFQNLHRDLYEISTIYFFFTFLFKSCWMCKCKNAKEGVQKTISTLKDCFLPNLFIFSSVIKFNYFRN